MRAALAALLVLASAAHAAPEEFVVEPQHTYPSFEVTHLGISTQRGRFEKTMGLITLDREAGTGRIDIHIDARTISTGNRVLDAVIRGEDFLNVELHPAMTFRGRSMVFEDGVPKSATGQLTMAGVTRPVELTVSRFGCTRLPFFVRLTCGADVFANLKRSEFGITAFSAFVGEDVRLEIQIEAVKVEPAAQPPPAGG